MQNDAAANSHTTKDDIIRLMHLFKEPVAQRHWSNLYGVLKRAELDARKSHGEHSEIANPLDCLAELFNDYENFRPQNAMVQYVASASHEAPVKKQPYQASSSEWSYLANYTHDLEPTNLSRKHIIRGADWIKSTWGDCRKYLHLMFLQYHRSGQNDNEKDEWGSQTEYKRWVRAAHWKTTGSNSIIRYTQAMIYSVAVLDLCDFESIGRKMPKGQGVDATVNDGTLAPKHKSKKRSAKKERTAASKSQKCIVAAIEKADEWEAQMAALKLFLRFGSSAEKEQAKRELAVFAFRNSNSSSLASRSASNNEDEEDDTGDVDDTSSTSTSSSVL